MDFFLKGTLHHTVALYLVTVKVMIYSFMMCKYVCVKTALYPASHILPMDINELCVSPDRICPYLEFGGICGNANVHYLVDIIVTPFGRPTVIGGLLAIVYSWELIGLI